MLPSPPLHCLVSSCLMGLCTRYDAHIVPDKHCIEHLQKSAWIPVCPEQLGGLPTPREKAKLIDGDGYDVLANSARVMTDSGKDVTQNFIKGAEQVLKLARARSISTIILKSRSPSCGISGKIGVTAALLKVNGFKLIEF